MMYNDDSVDLSKELTALAEDMQQHIDRIRYRSLYKEGPERD